MNLTAVFTQMGVILVFLVLGYYIRKRSFISDEGVRSISWIIVNIASPAQILSSVLNEDPVADKGSAVIMVLFTVISYAALIILGLVMGRIVRAPRNDWKFYNGMTVFSNTGFLGIPFAQAVFGNTSVVYLVIFTLALNVLLFSYGYRILRNDDGGKQKMPWIKLVNLGMIGSVLAVVFFFTDIRLPDIFNKVFLYQGNTVTFLAILVIGMNLAKIRLSSIFTDWHMWLFVIIRQLVFPIGMVLIFRNFIHDPILLGALAVCLSVPVGNVPSMIARDNGCDLDVLTRGTVLTTLCSVVTMTVTLLFAA